MTNRFKKIVEDYILGSSYKGYEKREFLNSIDDKINPHNDWDFDSLEMTEFIMTFELEYSIEISDTEAVNVQNLGELCELCENKYKEKIN
jgi:acyl carrier protein